MFEGIKEFVSVSTLGSFSAAANELNVSTAHVSRQVKALEERLGIKLFLRNTRSVEITEQGQRYYVKCLQVIDAMQEADDEAKNQHLNMSGSIKIAAGGDYSEWVIGPIVSEFARRHQDVNIEMHFSDKNQNLIENNYDFAIRYGELNDSNYIAKKIAVRTLRFAASASYLKEYGTPSHPKELYKHRCIASGNRQWRYVDKYNDKNVHDSSVSNHGVPVNNIIPIEKHRTISVNPVWKSNSAKLMVEHALAHGGICYLPSDTIAQFDEQSELVTVLPQYSYKNMPTYLVYPDKHYIPKRVRYLMDYIIEQTSQYVLSS